MWRYLTLAGATLVFMFASSPVWASTVTAASLGVTVSTEPCPGYPDAQGCYLAETRTIHWTDGDVRTREHELAHAWAADHMTAEDQAWLARPSLLGRGEWFSGSGKASVGERFAEAWAYCRYPIKAGEGVEAAYGYKPRGYRHRRVCNTISILRVVR
jgi:hypothetical protein